MILKGLEAQVLYEIQKEPRIQKFRICRKLNHRSRLCSGMSCFANAKIRAEFNGGKKPRCPITKARTFYAIKKLQKLGLIKTRREKKEDGREKRGWDYMAVSYSTAQVWIGGD